MFLSSSGIFRFEPAVPVGGGETLLGKLNVVSLPGRPSEQFAAVQSVKKGYAMKIYALACCILALSAQAVRADAFLPGPDKYENSFIHTAAFTPVGKIPS